MDFRTAVGILGRQITTQEIADAIGLSRYTIRQARLQEGAVGHRSPPRHWRKLLLTLATARRDELNSLINELEKGGD
jgi:hypothetical protein